MTQLRAWFQATRPRAPSNLSQRVVARLEREAALDHEAALRGSGSPATSPRRSPPRTRPRLAWILAPAAVLAAVLVVALPGRREPIPAGDEASLQSPSHTPPAGQTSRSATTGDAERNTVRYVFTVKAARAREICLAGDFNHWKVCDAPLTRVGEDVWSIAVDLPPGRHEYMFVVDGKWMPDPTSVGYVEDGFGNRNSLLVI